jgi:dynein assembly factor 5
LILDEEPEIS